MKLELNEIKIGDKVRAAYPTNSAVFVYYGEVVALDQHTVTIQTFDGCVCVPATSRIFTDEPAPVLSLRKDKV